MSPSFARYATTSGRYEPEGIYLSAPLEGACVVIQGWGAHPEAHGAYTYNGVPLKGHPGVDLAAAPGAAVLAVDNGRVTEISIERGGVGRYLKLEHAWGESFYAHLDDVLVEAGQAVTRGQPLAHVAAQTAAGAPAHLHWALRIAPYNRFDGWGGFTDPLPYLVAAEVSTVESGGDEAAVVAIPPMLAERPGMRRP